MKELKVILSPHFSGEEYFDEVSGIAFEKGRGINTYTINLENSKLSGIQSALRKNILLPFDKATNEFVNGNKIVKEEAVEVVEVVEPKKSDKKEETPTKEEAPKKTRTRKMKKETE